MRVRIVGPGAVGTLFGALLAEAGHEITFVGRRAEALPSEQGGVRVVLPDRWLRFRPQACLAPSAAEARSGKATADLVVVALRRDHLRELRSTHGGGSLLTVAAPSGEAAPLLFLNCDERDTDGLLPPPGDDRGSRDGRSAGAAGAGRVLRGLTLWTAVRLERGTVELGSGPSAFVTVKDPALKPVVAALRAGGIETAVVDSIEPYLGPFFLWQLLFVPMAMCCATYEYFLSFAEGREIAAAVIEEGLRILERFGGELRRLPVMDPRELALRLRKARQTSGTARFVPDRGYNSLLQALLRGEKTEVRELNERLVKLGGNAGVEASWNWRLARKLGRVARLGFYRDPAELYLALS